MSTLPATDIVTDVARAADPARVDAATRRLAALSRAPAAAGDAFGATLSGVSAGAITTGATTAAPLGATTAAPVHAAAVSGTRTAGATSDPAAAAAGKFEAFVLQSFIEEMLPKEGGAAFGHGPGAGVWRSMMAEQLSNQLVKAGGVGLRKMLLSHGPQAVERKTG